MKIRACVAAGMVLAGGLASAVTTNVCYVAEGQTKSVADFGYTFASGDWLRKTGPGRLNASNNKSTVVNLLIEEGVYYVGNSTYQKGGATLIVKEGATMNCAGTVSEAFMGNWDVYFQGDGVGTGDNLGAICLGGSALNQTFGTLSKFYMNGDATLYGYGTMNAVISGSGADNGPTLDMGKHTLTMRGKSSTSVFRPRWKWTIKNAGPMIVMNGQFARHDTTNDFTPNIPSVTVISNGMLATYDDGKIWSKVDAFYFDWGTSMAKGNDSPSGNATLTMKT